MRIDVYPTRNYVKEKDIRDRITVVIDVLRATTTIITALYNGCKEVIPVAEIEEAVNISKNYDEDTYILGGERYAKKIEGFHLSNSPREYTKEMVKEKTVLLTTTNGTRAITKAGDGKETILASFTNISMVCNHIKNIGEDVVIICAGTLGYFSSDDVLVAGALILGLKGLGVTIEADDLGMAAEFMYEKNKDGIHRFLSKTQHYSTLKGMGLQNDLDYCLSLDTTPIIPIYKDGIVRIQAG